MLVVDDDRDTRDLLQLLLTARGATVRTASSTAEAVNSFSTTEPDVLIADIGMPGEDGYALLERLRSMNPAASFRAIAVSGYVGDEDRSRGADRRVPRSPAQAAGNRRPAQEHRPARREHAQLLAIRPQRHHRIDPRRASRRNVGCQQRDAGEDGRHRGIGRRVGRPRPALSGKYMRDIHPNTKIIALVFI